MKKKIFNTNPKKIIRYQGLKYSLGDLFRLWQEQGSLIKVSNATHIPYGRLYSIFKKYTGKKISRLKTEIGLIKGKRRGYNFNLKKIIRLFKKYGFLPDVARITDIPAATLRKILMKEFGIGLFELRQKLGIKKSCLKRRAIDRKAFRFQQVKEAYERLGTLERTGKELGLTRQRVSQILSKGKQLGLFSYERKSSNLRTLKRELSREILIKDIELLCSGTKICLKYNINNTKLKTLLQYFNIDLKEYQRATRAGKYIQGYSKIVDALGYHPTTTELNSRPEWRKIWVGIDRYWDSIDNFRKAFGIEKPKQKVHPNTLLAFQKSKEKRSLIKREKKEKVLNLIRQEGPISAALIRNKLELKPAMTWNYIKELSEGDLISKTGKGSGVKYAITTDKSRK